MSSNWNTFCFLPFISIQVFFGIVDSHSLLTANLTGHSLLSGVSDYLSDSGVHSIVTAFETLRRFQLAYIEKMNKDIATTITALMVEEKQPLSLVKLLMRQLPYMKYRGCVYARIRALGFKNKHKMKNRIRPMKCEKRKKSRRNDNSSNKKRTNEPPTCTIYIHYPTQITSHCCVRK